MARIVIYDTATGLVKRIVIDETKDAERLSAVHLTQGEALIVVPEQISIDLTVESLAEIQAEVVKATGLKP